MRKNNFKNKYSLSAKVHWWPFAAAALLIMLASGAWGGDDSSSKPLPELVASPLENWAGCTGSLAQSFQVGLKMGVKGFDEDMKKLPPPPKEGAGSQALSAHGNDVARQAIYRMRQRSLSALGSLDVVQPENVSDDEFTMGPWEAVARCRVLGTVIGTYHAGVEKLAFNGSMCSMDAARWGRFSAEIACGVDAMGSQMNEMPEIKTLASCNMDFYTRCSQAVERRLQARSQVCGKGLRTPSQADIAALTRRVCFK